jgi:hypothetical protein
MARCCNRPIVPAQFSSNDDDATCEERQERRQRNRSSNVTQHGRYSALLCFLPPRTYLFIREDQLSHDPLSPRPLVAESAAADDNDDDGGRRLPTTTTNHLASQPAAAAAATES